MHHFDHMQTICTSLQTDNHTNTSSFNFYRPDTLPDAQQCQSNEDASGNGDITDELKQFNEVADGEQTVLANLAMS